MSHAFYYNWVSIIWSPLRIIGQTENHRWKLLSLQGVSLKFKKGLWTSSTWKFLTDACVTLPWKLRTYDCVSSFQTGVLLWSSRMPSMDLALYLSIRPSWEELALKAIRWPSEVMPGSTTVILRGPLNPRTFVSYITPTSSWRWLERSCKAKEN